MKEVWWGQCSSSQAQKSLAVGRFGHSDSQSRHGHLDLGLHDSIGGDKFYSGPVRELQVIRDHLSGSSCVGHKGFSSIFNGKIFSCYILGCSFSFFPIAAIGWGTDVRIYTQQSVKVYHGINQRCEWTPGRLQDYKILNILHFNFFCINIYAFNFSCSYHFYSSRRELGYFRN